jgi:hypothetical protein
VEYILVLKTFFVSYILPQEASFFNIFVKIVQIRLKYSSTLPYAFTEHGAIMAANVLKSDSAVRVSVYVVRAFIKLREMLLSNKEFSDKLKELEQKVEKHDKTIHFLVVTLGRLMQPTEIKDERKIGFKPDKT